MIHFCKRVSNTGFDISINVGLNNDWTNNLVAGDLRRQKCFHDTLCVVNRLLWNKTQGHINNQYGCQYTNHGFVKIISGLQPTLLVMNSFCILATVWYCHVI